MVLIPVSTNEVALNRRVRSSFEQLVVAIEHGVPPSDQLIADFRESIVIAGFGTDQNKSASDLVDFLPIPTATSKPGQEFGLSTRCSHIPYSKLLWHLEGIPIPEELRLKYPELTQAEFDGMLRIVTMIFSANTMRVQAANT